MKSILFLDESTGLPAALLVQGFVYDGAFHGTRIDALNRAPTPIALPYSAYLEILNAGDPSQDAPQPRK